MSCRCKLDQGILLDMYLLFHDIKDSNKTEAIDTLIKESTGKPSFYFLVILSVLMATYGLILNNTSVVIGSMLIAPILSPMLSLALGITLSDSTLIKRSMNTFLKSILYSIGIAMLATFLMWGTTGTEQFQEFYNPEILSRTEASFTYLMIAIVAGLATSFARVKPELNEALPGTAIAVALVPPLATIGIGVATLNITVTLGAFIMFALNALGIIIASVFMFSIMKIYKKHKVAQKSLQEAELITKETEEDFKKSKEKPQD